ncbi:MAG: FHA domain-containing protein [Actinomycetota bacterium]|nr:FHA domain-containing protein [Actinomycetota bacterium]
MQIVIQTAGVARDVDVNVQVPDATVADLLDALGQHTDDDAVGIVVDGRRLPGYLALAEAGLHDGAVVHLGDAGQRPAGSDGAGPALAVVGGLDTGRRITLPHGRAVIGRDVSCAVRLASSTVSSRHCAVDVDPFGVVSLEDLGSRNGALIDGVTLTGRHELSPGQIVQLGAVQLTLVARDPHDRPALLGARRTAGGNTSFNRPPRSMPPAPGEPVPLPKPPREAPVRQPFSWIAVLAPLALAAVLVLVTGSFLYAMFALLSPVMLIGNWAEGRRQGKHTSRRETARFAADLDTFRTQLAGRRGEATLALRAELPESSEILRRASAPSVRLWERRLTDPDFLHLSAGTGSIDWRPVVANPHGERPAEVTRVVAEMSRLELVPALVDLADGGVVGITGPRAAGLALARSLVCQAAVHHGPADLRIAVLTEPEGVVAWEWVKWLPHNHDAAAGGGARLLAADTAAADSLMHELFEAHRARPEADRNNRDGGPGGPVLFAVVDAVRLTEGRNAPVRALLRGAAGPVAGIVLAPTTDRLPAVCTTVVELLDADGTARLSRPPLGEVVDGLLIGWFDTSTARSCALPLARFEDPETAAVGASLPIRVDVTTLFDQDVFDPAVVEELWRSAGREGGHDPGVAAPIGVTEEGVLTLDLLRDGPHGLVGRQPVPLREQRPGQPALPPRPAPDDRRRPERVPPGPPGTELERPRARRPRRNRVHPRGGRGRRPGERRSLPGPGRLCQRRPVRRRDDPHRWRRRERGKIRQQGRARRREVRPGRHPIQPEVSKQGHDREIHYKHEPARLEGRPDRRRAHARRWADHAGQPTASRCPADRDSGPRQCACPRCTVPAGAGPRRSE